MRKCMQEKCGLNESGTCACKRCAECNCAPLFVSDDCIRCYKCENVPGEIRWDDNDTIDDLLNGIKKMIEEILKDENIEKENHTEEQICNVECGQVK